MISIIDYGVGNLRSVEKAFEYVGAKVRITSRLSEILEADKVVLPGVGAFEEAMNKMKKAELVDTIKRVIDEDKPFLGICLGMQLLFDYSEEGNQCSYGLGAFSGSIKRFPNNMGLKIPHIGWNSIKIANDNKFFHGIDDNEFFYFVHSYYLQSTDRAIVAASCEYGIEFDAAITSGNMVATQFHPEKSGTAGLKLLKNFAQI